MNDMICIFAYAIFVQVCLHLYFITFVIYHRYWIIARSRWFRSTDFRAVSSSRLWNNRLPVRRPDIVSCSWIYIIFVRLSRRWLTDKLINWISSMQFERLAHFFFDISMSYLFWYISLFWLSHHELYDSKCD